MSTQFGDFAERVAGEMVADGRLQTPEAERAPVWLALSEFWPDTEQTDGFMSTLARVVAATPFSIDEVRRIHTHEVSPAVWLNLLDVAGEWAMLPRECLFARCARVARRQRGPRATLARLVRWPAVRNFTGSKVDVLLARVQMLRTDPGVPLPEDEPHPSVVSEHPEDPSVPCDRVAANAELERRFADIVRKARRRRRIEWVWSIAVGLALAAGWYLLTQFW